MNPDLLLLQTINKLPWLLDLRESGVGKDGLTRKQFFCCFFVVVLFCFVFILFYFLLFIFFFFWGGGGGGYSVDATAF